MMMKSCFFVGSKKSSTDIKNKNAFEINVNVIPKYNFVEKDSLLIPEKRFGFF